MNKKTKIKGYIVLLFLLATWISMRAQAGLYGNAFVLGSSDEFALHHGDIEFGTDNLGALPGIVGTERSFPQGFVSFFNSAKPLSVSDVSHIDGYVRSYQIGKFIFPIGDNGKYRPIAIDKSDIDNPTSAAYFGVNPSVATTSKLLGGIEPVLPASGPFSTASLGEKVLKVSNYEYWDINGTVATKITLTWNANSNVTTITKGDFRGLSIVGWDGFQWVVIPSTIDGTSIFGTSSDLNSGSVTTNASIVPNTYEVYTLAGITVQKNGDTTIRPVDTSTIVLGLPAISDPNTNYSLGGPYHGSGKVSINVKTGVITFKPSDTPFIGKDTMYKIRCVTIGALTVCDSARILIDGQPPKRTPVGDSTNYNTGKTLADLPPINTGSKPYTTTTSSSAGSIVNIGSDGKIHYVPRNGFSGYDTVRVIRCVDGVCDSVTYIIKVNPPLVIDLPNFISPNGDGLNDYWVLPPALYNQYPQIKAVIYNRWGNIVWRSTSTYKDDWYGQSLGSSQPVPDGVYFYLLEMDSEFRTSKTGFIEVMRR